MKAQTALEYLVLIAVSIIVVVALINVLDDSVDAGGKAIATADIIALERQPIGIIGFDVSAKQFYLQLVNHNAQRVVINQIMIDDVPFNSSDLPLSLVAEETASIESYSVLLQPNFPYTYYILINYTDTELGIEKIQYLSSLPLVGLSKPVDNEIDPDENMGTGLVGLWHFDETWDGTANEVKDALGVSHGTASGAQTSEDALIDRAGQFDGSDTISIGSSALNITNNITVSFWMRSSASQANAPLLGKMTNDANGWQIYKWSSNDALRVRVGTEASANQTILAASNIFDDLWHHIAITIGDGKVRSFVDGDFALNGTYVGNQINATSPLLIGSDLGEYYTGSLDEVAIWNRTLTLQEIESLYERGVAELDVG